MAAGSDFAQSVAEAARILHKSRTLDDTLQTIVEVACNSVPGFEHVGIATMQKNAEVETRAFTGDLVVGLDAAQYALHEGPGSAVLQGEESVCVSSMGSEDRWPRYAARARAAGVRSQLAIKLHLNDDVLGGINFYSTVHDEVSPDAQALALLFGTHAAIALGHARERETFTEGLQTRRAIGQAIGILMERYGVDEDRAFAFLVRASSHANIKLRAVAQELVAEANNR